MRHLTFVDPVDPEPAGGDPALGARNAPRPAWPIRLRLDFRFSELTCTRTLVVRANTTLDDLHTMIQACGNWTNSHLYRFELVWDSKLARAEPAWQSDEMGSGLPGTCLDSSKVYLIDAVTDLPSMNYCYDYGDGWEVNVLFLGHDYGPEPAHMPICVAGQGAWPPDDVGGEGGFVELLRVLDDPSDPEHESMREWALYQGYERYSRDRCNSRLRHWEDFRAIFP